MSGLVMQAALEQRFIRYGIQPQVRAVPLSPPTDHVMVLGGLAPTGDIDHERVRFLPFAFGPLPLPSHLPLLYDHDPDQEAGCLDSLQYTATGNLEVVATVTHKMARRCGAWSVGARIHDFIIHDGAGFYAEVRKATLTDISLVVAPGNPAALVTSRRPLAPTAEFYGLMERKIECIIKTTALIQKGVHP